MILFDPVDLRKTNKIFFVPEAGKGLLKTPPLNRKVNFLLLP